MAFPFLRKNCYKCGDVRHFAGDCPQEQRLCFNCRKPGHESAACTAERTSATKQCFTCGGVGHLQAECPNLRLAPPGGSKCYTCGVVGHYARHCPNGTGANFASRVALPSRGLNTSTLPPVKCRRCNGPNHLAKDCLARGTTVNDNTPTGPANPNKYKTCYKCQQVGHIARECEADDNEYV